MIEKESKCQKGVYKVQTFRTTQKAATSKLWRFVDRGISREER